jgi:hypothetical protein
VPYGEKGCTLLGWTKYCDRPPTRRTHID